MDIIEKVKNTVLEWTLKLEEEGVLGEGMRFSDKEKQNAKALPQTVNNSNFAPCFGVKISPKPV